jgi:hypothetical protein
MLALRFLRIFVRVDEKKRGHVSAGTLLNIPATIIVGANLYCLICATRDEIDSPSLKWFDQENCNNEEQT